MKDDFNKFRSFKEYHIHTTFSHTLFIHIHVKEHAQEKYPGASLVEINEGTNGINKYDV